MYQGSIAGRLLPLLAAALFVAGLLSTRPATAAGNPHVSGKGAYLIGTTHTVEFDVNAVQHKDGTVTGQLVLAGPFFTSADVTVIDLDCLGFIGNRAIVGGTIVAASGAFESTIGLPAYFSFQDNGEGSKAPADLASPFFVLGDGTHPDCLDPDVVAATLLAFPVVNGNVQVKP